MNIKKNEISEVMIISNLAHDDVYWIRRYVIKIVSDLRQVGGFSGYSGSNETDLH
jgi:hypothetical protein